MQRIPEKPQRVYMSLNLYAFIMLLLALTGLVVPWLSLIAALLLLIGPPLLLLHGLYHVAPDSQPSRDEQILRLVAVYTLGTLLVGNVTATQIAALLLAAAPTPGTPLLSLVDRVMLAVTSGLLMWGLLAGLAYVADAMLVERRAFIKAWHCRRCGYDLRGSTTDRCPECAEPVHCRRCGRSMTGQRDEVCMYCGTPRVADPYDAPEE